MENHGRPRSAKLTTTKKSQTSHLLNRSQSIRILANSTQGESSWRKAQKFQ